MYMFDTIHVACHYLTTPTSSQMYNYLFAFIWANDKTVQNALNVREVCYNFQVQQSYILYIISRTLT